MGPGKSLEKIWRIQVEITRLVFVYNDNNLMWTYFSPFSWLDRRPYQCLPPKTNKIVVWYTCPTPLNPRQVCNPNIDTKSKNKSQISRVCLRAWVEVRYPHANVYHCHRTCPCPSNSATIPISTQAKITPMFLHTSHDIAGQAGTSPRYWLHWSPQNFPHPIENPTRPKCYKSRVCQLNENYNFINTYSPAESYECAESNNDRLTTQALNTIKTCLILLWKKKGEKKRYVWFPALILFGFDSIYAQQLQQALNVSCRQKTLPRKRCFTFDPMCPENAMRPPLLDLAKRECVFPSGFLSHLRSEESSLGPSYSYPWETTRATDRKGWNLSLGLCGGEGREEDVLHARVFAFCTLTSQRAPRTRRHSGRMADHYITRLQSRRQASYLSLLHLPGQRR